jgi:hypothetical protein
MKGRSKLLRPFYLGRPQRQLLRPSLVGGQGRNAAAPCFGLVGAATDTASFARPRIALVFNPGRHKHSQNSRSLALGYGVKPFQGKLKDYACDSPDWIVPG